MTEQKKLNFDGLDVDFYEEDDVDAYRMEIKSVDKNIILNYQLDDYNRRDIESFREFLDNNLGKHYIKYKLRDNTQKIKLENRELIYDEYEFEYNKDESIFMTSFKKNNILLINLKFKMNQQLLCKMFSDFIHFSS